VRTFAVREPLHEAGSYVAHPIETPRTSRWRAGPTTFGPAGRILSTLVLILFFPWWGVASVANPFFLWSLMGWLIAAAFVLRSVWKRERIAEGPPSRFERFRERHPLLGRTIRLEPGARYAVLLVAAGAALIAWLALDDVARYVWAVVAIVSGLGILLSSWADL
jgi:hypothetical protein